MPSTYSAIEVPFPHPKSQVNQYESSQLVPNFVKKVTSHIHTLQQTMGPAALLLRHWYEIMALYYVKSILTEISAFRQDRRVLQKSKIIRIKFLSIRTMLSLDTSRNLKTISLTLLLRHWYEIMTLYYVKSILTGISASRQDKRVLQKKSDKNQIS